MRVVFLTHNYPRFPGDIAGNFLHPLAVALRARGVDVRVIAPSDEGSGGRSELDGVPIHRVRYADAAHETLAYRGTMATALRTPNGMRAMAGMVRAFSNATREELSGAPDGVVHAHWWFPAAVAIPGRARSVVTCHGTDIRLLDTSRMFRALGRRVLRRVGMITTVSGFLARIVERRLGRRLDQSQVQGMPLAAVERPRSVGGEGVVLLGRLTPQKRLDLAFAALKLAHERGVVSRVTVVGDGPERARLMTLAGGLGLGDVVRFAGHVAANDVPRFLACADVAVMTAHHEGLGLAAAESMIQGVPTVVCSDGGGLLDVVPGSGGGRIVAPTAQAVADAVAELVGDPAERDAAVRVGEVWRDRLTPDAVAATCEGWYRRVCDE
jgi:glycosyltransferase involved in cell wall biosynthesis